MLKRLHYPASRRKSMPKLFGEASTTDEVLSGVNLKGKRVLVAVVFSGFGEENWLESISNKQTPTNKGNNYEN
jgi:hypothetical protein